MLPIIDWQISRNDIKSRGQYLLETGKWADCNFLVGQQILSCHKLILAMASPVFEAMFYGSLANSGDEPIPILDVQPEAFKALLEYIYTDKININSVDKACELCYGAKKYMLPHVVEECTKFLWSDLCAKNVCRAYEFAKLFEEPRLIEKCLQIMCTKTLDVMQDPSFDDVEISTIITILDQDVLNVDSELNLFFAISRYAEKQGLQNQNQSPNELSANQNQNAPPNVDVVQIADEGADIQIPGPAGAQQPPGQGRQVLEAPTIRDVIKRIRFLSLSPQQFAEGPARTNLLTQSEAFAILMNISTPNSVYPMPEGFSTNKNTRICNISLESETPSPAAAGPSHIIHDIALSHRDRDSPVHDEKYYCARTIRQQTECLNTSVLDSCLTFTVDRNICITGIQVPTQVHGSSVLDHHNAGIQELYSELLYAHLLDSQGSRLSYTHCTQRVRYASLLEISFDRPIRIDRCKIYKVGVAFNKIGWYPISTCFPNTICDNVAFTFGVGSHSESIRDGLIRSIVFTHARDRDSNCL